MEGGQGVSSTHVSADVSGSVFTVRAAALTVTVQPRRVVIARCSRAHEEQHMRTMILCVLVARSEHCKARLQIE